MIVLYTWWEVCQEEYLMEFIHDIYNLFWGDLFTIPLPGGKTIGISLLVLILIPSGIFFSVKTKFLPIRMFKEMVKIAVEKKEDSNEGAITGVQALIVSTATRVGMGNMVGVVAAVSAGGAGAIFWMWITALIGASTAFVEATLAQLYKQKDPLYGGYRGGPAYYIHQFFTKGKRRYSVIAILFALSALLCWGGVSQVISFSVTSAFENAFGIKPIISTLILVMIASVVVLRKDATVKVLDLIVPIMAIFYFMIAILTILMNLSLLPEVFVRIISEAFGIRQVVAGGFGAVLMNGVKRGLFSNEAGSGSAPCAAAAADVSHPAKAGLFQAFGVLIDTIIICTCTAMIMLLAPESVTNGLEGMALLQAAMNHHFGYVGVVFTTITLWLFSFSTFIGILYYARSNVAYLFNDNWLSQTIYKVFALAMLFIGGIASYEFVWELGDIGIALMTIFNNLVILPMSKEALDSLKEYEKCVE